MAGSIVSGFSVRLDGLDLGMWTEASLGGMTLAVTPQAEGGKSSPPRQLGGELKYEPIRLSRVVTDAMPSSGVRSSIGEWFRSVARESRRMHGEIVLYGWRSTVPASAMPQTAAAREAEQRAAWVQLQTWSFIGAVPVKWSIPAMRSGDLTPLIETLEIAHEGFTESIAPAAGPTATATGTQPGPAEKLEKAYLEICPVAADGTSAGATKTLAFRINPSEYRVAKSSAWMRTTARSAAQAGALQWRGAHPSRMTLTLVLDEEDSPAGTVLTDVEDLLSCCAPTSDSVERGQPSAPYVSFGWGTSRSFKAVVHEVDVTFTKFRNDGQPCRASATVTLEQVDVPPVRQNPTSGSDSVTRTHTVVAGDRLPLVAYRMYGDATLWRVLADANRIEDPLTLRAGQTLLVPAAHAVDGSRP